MPGLQSLMQKLDYQFNQLHLLEAALTHRSVRGQNNERLEFLGDSLLNFIIAEVLYLQLGNAKEGELSRLRASLVQGETLAEIAQELNLGDFLRLGPGELKSGGFLRKSILADALEAVIGAIYLDSNFDNCRSRVLAWFSTRIQQVHPRQPKDPKSQLQEYLQARHLPLPQYNIVSVEGEAHAQIFHIECHVPTLPLVTASQGSTRRKAEQLAAALYLQRYKKELH